MSTEDCSTLPFRAEAFDQCYQVHMAIFAACSLLTVNLINSMPRSCLSHPLGLIIPSMLALFVGGAAMRWHHRTVRQLKFEADPTSVDLAEELVSHARSNSWALFYSFLTFGLYCIYAATHKGNDLCDGDDLFNEVMPTWIAHIGPIELLVGVACSTYGISLRRIVVNGGVVHSAFAVCQLLLFLGRGTRSASLYAACHLVQYVSFGVGVYLGDALLNGQKYYFDQAAALNIRLLERRVEQLTVGKERGEYDRGMAQHSYQRLLTHLSSEEERKLSQTVHEIDRPSDNGSSCSCSGIMDDPSTCEDPTPVQALELLQPGVALDGSPSLSNPKGAAMSDSGWSDISRLLKVVDRKQNDDNALAVSSRLNPQAQEWSELSAQHAAQHMSQPGPLRTPGPLHVAVQPAQPATIVEHGCEQGGSQKAQAQKSATAIRREKRKRAAQRDLLRLEQQKAELGQFKSAVMTANIPAMHPQYPFPPYRP